MSEQAEFFLSAVVPTPERLAAIRQAASERLARDWETAWERAQGDYPDIESILQEGLREVMRDAFKTGFEIGLQDAREGLSSALYAEAYNDGVESGLERCAESH